MGNPVSAGMAGLSLIGSAISARGTLMGGKAAAIAGANARAASEFTALGQEQQAGEARSAAQIASQERRRQTGLALSALRARGAADGGSATDTGVLDLAGGIGERGEFASLLELAKGENTARGQEDAARATRMQGEAALWEGMQKQKASKLSALGTIIGGAGSAFRAFGPGGR
jgi:hypothetical protein